MKKPLIYFLFSIFSFSFFSLHSQIINSIAGNGFAGYSGDGGPATDAEINFPNDVAVDDSGNIYESDFYGDVIRKIDGSTGIISTVVGNSYPGFTGDGGPATAAELNMPTGICKDRAGNLYITDYINQRIRKVNGGTGIITTIAGTGFSGFSGEGGPASLAELQEPEDASIDDSGNVYIADTYNYRIRKISVLNGFIYTIVGNGAIGYSGDGGSATLAEIAHTEKLKSDANGDLYIADAGNSSMRYFDATTGIITTIAGNGVPGSSGDGGPATAAEFTYMEAIAFDNGGNLYVADLSNENVRKIDKITGIITSIAGNGSSGFSGDGGPATLAELRDPMGVDVDKSGNLYITDTRDNHIRKVTGVYTGVPVVADPLEVNVYPVPNSGSMTLQLPGEGYISVLVFDEFGRQVYHQPLDVNQLNRIFGMNLGNLRNGVYFIQIITMKGTINKRVIIEK